MKLRDLYLTEGIIKVPPTLLKQINLYVSSIYSTKIADSIQMVNQIGRMSVTGTRLYDQDLETVKREFIPQLNKILKYLQSNYGAKILNNASYSKIINSSIKLNVPVQEMMSELPKNLQTPEVQRNLEELTTRLRISYGTEDRYYAGLSHRRDHTDHIIQITLNDLGNTPQSAFEVIRNGFSTVYHEAQHYIQHEVINFVDKSAKQTQRKDGYSNVYDINNKDTNAYHASAVEYTPQIGDLGHLAISNLEDMKENGTLTGDKNKDITAAVKLALESEHRTEILKALKSYGEIDRYNKGLKTVYSMVAKKYDSVINSEHDDNSEVDINNREDLEHDEDLLDTLYNMIDDSNLKVLQPFSAVQRNKKMQFKFKDENDPYVNTIKFNDDGTYELSLYQGSKEKYSFIFDDAKRFMQVCNELIHSDKIEYLLEVYEWLDYDNKPSVNSESIEQMLSELQSQYGGKIEGNYIVLPKADDGMDVYVDFSPEPGEDKQGKMSTSYTNEIDGLGFNDMKEIASLILQTIPKGADEVNFVLNKYKTKDDIIKGLEELKNKTSVTDSDIERTLQKVHHDLTEIYDFKGTAKIDSSRLKISFKFPNYVRFQPSIKDKSKVEMVYKGNWHYIPLEELYEVAYYIVLNYDQDPDYITKLLSSPDYSDEEFVGRIKDAHMGEDNYFGW